MSLDLCRERIKQLLMNIRVADLASGRREMAPACSSQIMYQFWVGSCTERAQPLFDLAAPGIGPDWARACK